MGTKTMVAGLGLAVLAIVASMNLTACEPAPDAYVALGDSAAAAPFVPDSS